MSAAGAHAQSQQGGGAEQQPGQREHGRLQARAGPAAGPRQRSDRARPGQPRHGRHRRRRRRRADERHVHRLFARHDAAHAHSQRPGDRFAQHILSGAARQPEAADAGRQFSRLQRRACWSRRTATRCWPATAARFSSIRPCPFDSCPAASSSKPASGIELALLRPKERLAPAKGRRKLLSAPTATAELAPAEDRVVRSGYLEMSASTPSRKWSS